MARSELWELRQDWAVAIHREWERLSEVGGSGKGGFRKKVSGLLSEWSDVLVVGAHYAYGNDIFCTLDGGIAETRRGEPAVLDANNRAWLTEEFGIQFSTLSELAQRLSK